LKHGIEPSPTGLPEVYKEYSKQKDAKVKEEKERVASVG
jgi:hypothetical protein